MQQTQTHTFKLLGTSPSKPFTDVQFIFGAMVQYATPVMTDYHSDLWHDAMWLDKHMTHILPEERRSFHWYVSATHTFIGKEPVCAGYRPRPRDLHYLFTVYYASNGWWCMDVTKLDTKEE